MSPINYSVGLGAIVPDGSFGGTAEYQYFNARPYAASGTWESAVLDRGGVPSQPGTISWDASMPLGASVAIRTRTSQDKALWSEWTYPYSNASGSLVTSPLGRYIRIQATLNIGSSGDTPVLHSISVKQPDFDGDFMKSDAVKVVPNPARGTVVNLQYVLTSAASAVRLEFRGPAGKLLLEDEGPKALGLNTYTLDSSLLANGVYYAKVRAKPMGAGEEVNVIKKFAVLR